MYVFSFYTFFLLDFFVVFDLVEIILTTREFVFEEFFANKIEK